MRELNKLIQYTEDVNNIEKKCYSRLLCISNKFTEIREREEKKLPPQFNLVSALLGSKSSKRLHETKHSRILYHLLKDKHIQASFLDNFLGQYNLQGNMEVEVEKEHIDVYLHNDETAIIIENKINNACDGIGQLLNYTKHINEIYPKNCIFVIYISNDGHGPRSTSTESDTEDINDFIDKNHLLTYSYDRDILQWLKNYLADIENEKRYDTKLIKSALIQYIDYLEELFQISSRYEPMNKELDKYLINELGLEDLPLTQTIELLDNKINSLDNLRERLEALHNKYQEKQYKEYFKQWYKECVSIIGNDITVRKTGDYEFGFSFKFHRTEFDCIISKEDKEDHETQYFWGVYGTYSNKNSKPRAFENLRNYILDSNKGFTNAEDNSDEWVISDYADPNEIVERFTTLAQLIYDNEECILT